MSRVSVEACITITTDAAGEGAPHSCVRVCVGHHIAHLTPQQAMNMATALNRAAGEVSLAISEGRGKNMPK